MAPKDPLRIEGDKVRRDAARRTDDAARRVRRAVGIIQDQIRDGKPGLWVSRRADLLAAHPDSGVFVGWIDNAVQCWTMCLADSVESCAHLIGYGTDSQISTLAVARVGLDTASQLVHLLGGDPRDDNALLIRAALCAWQDDDDEQPMWQWAQPRGLAVSGASLHTQRLTAASNALGFTVKRGRYDKVDRLIDVNGTEHKQPSATQLTRDMEKNQNGETQTAWRIASGASHGRPWMISHELMNPDRYPGSTARTAATAVISVTSIALACLGDTFGDERLRGDGRFLAETAQRLGTPPEPFPYPNFPLR